MAKIKEGTKVITNPVIASFPHVFERDNSDLGGGKYNVTLIIKKDDKETIDCIEKAIEAAKETGKSSKWNGSLPKKLFTPLRDGDEEKDTVKYKEFENAYFITAKSTTKPGVVDRHGEALDETEAEEIYSGVIVKASVNFYPYAASGSNGVACGLNNLMKWKDGTRLGGGRASAESDFDGEEDDDDLGLD